MPRYEARFSNGSWKLFDTFTYSAVEPHRRQVEAQAAALEANAGAAVVRGFRRPGAARPR